MVKSWFILSLICAASIGSMAQSTEHNSKRQRYCANFGTVEFEFRADSVIGKYLISVVAEPIEGIVKGKIENGLLDGVWTDRDGRGRILIGFGDGRHEFNGIFATSKNKSVWSGPWRGFCDHSYSTLSETQRRGIRCN